MLIRIDGNYETASGEYHVARILCLDAIGDMPVVVELESRDKRLISTYRQDGTCTRSGMRLVECGRKLQIHKGGKYQTVNGVYRVHRVLATDGPGECPVVVELVDAKGNGYVSTYRRDGSSPTWTWDLTLVEAKHSGWLVFDSMYVVHCYATLEEAKKASGTAIAILPFSFTRGDGLGK